MRLKWSLAVVFALIALFFFSSAFAAGNPPTGQAPMEFFGIGPEMFSDRGIAWAKSIGAVLNEAVSQFGITAAAVILLRQNLKSRVAVKEVKDRLDRVGQKTEANANLIAQVALASTPIGPSEVKVVNTSE